MAALVQSVTGTDANHVTLAAPGAGSLLFVFTVPAASGLTSIASGGTATWSLAKGFSYYDRIECWVGVNASAADTAVVLTGTCYHTIAGELSGMATSSVVDTTAQFSNQAGVGPPVGASITPTGGAAVVILAMSYDAAGGTFGTPSAGFTALAAFSGGSEEKAAYQIVASASGAYACGWTLPLLPNETSIAVALKQASGGGGGGTAVGYYRRRLLLGSHQTDYCGGGAASAGGGGSLPAHPRIWITPTVVTFLQLQATNNTTRWQNVKTLADASVAIGSGYTAGDEAALELLGAAYIATGTSSYATRAGHILDAYCGTNGAANLTALQGDSGYPYRGMYNIALGLDWCYAGLTSTQHHTAATWLMDAADWPWPESNASSPAYANTDPADNYYYGYLMTGLSALAASGDDTGTTTTTPGSGSNRPAFHIALIETKWSATLAPYLAIGAPVLLGTLAQGGVKGGVTVEGMNYGLGAMSNVARVALSYATCGVSLDVSILQATTLSTMQYTTPGFGYFIPYGDQALNSDGRMYVYYREDELFIRAVASAGATLNGQVQYWLDQIGQVPGTGAFVPTNCADELLLYDPAASSASDLSGLAKSYYAEGGGYFAYRESWTDQTALMFALDCGDISPGHRAKSAGALMIWVNGQWLSCNANIQSASGILQDTASFNTFTCGADWASRIGQNSGNQWDEYPNGSEGDPNGGTFVAAPSVATNLIWARENLVTAYGNDHAEFHAERNRQLTTGERVVAYVPSLKTFVVCDRITLATGYTTNQVIEAWHCLNSPSASGQQFTLSTPDASFHLYGDVLLPATGVTVAGAAVPSPDSNGDAISCHVVSVSPTSGSASYVIVTTLQVSSAGSRPHTVAAVNTSGHIAVTIDLNVVTIPLDGASAVTLT